jgi:hypothetical protein
MSTNLYIVRHGKISTDEKNRGEYLHLNEEGKAFGTYLDNHFKDIYFDHIFYQSTDIKTNDPYNICRSTIGGMKGVKSVFDKTKLSMAFHDLNEEGSVVLNIMVCFRSEGFNVLSNIINPKSEEQFSKDYHRVFHYRFRENHYRFIAKFSAEEMIGHS